MKVTRNIDTGDEKQTIRTISTKPKEHFEGRWKSGRLYPLYSVVVNNGTTFISQNAKMKEEPYVIYDADKKEFKAPDGWLIKEMSADSRVTALGGGGEGGVTPEEVEEMIKDKVDKVDGKGLSTNDYDNTEKNKVASAYQKPNNGIPKSDLAKAVQDVLDDADGAYKKPVTGIPFADLADGVQDSLSNADEAKAGLAGKQDTISDLQTIRTGAAAGATAYQKPSGGVPKSDLASSVQTSLSKADTAIQPAEFNELEEEVGTIGNGAYEEAWDGSSEPVVADIPAGVSVTYNSTSYTGTLAASASTVDKIYLVSDGNGNYDRYITVESSGTYSWKKVGTTAIPLPDYATKAEFSQLVPEVNQMAGKYKAVSAITGENKMGCVYSPSRYITPNDSAGDQLVFAVTAGITYHIKVTVTLAVSSFGGVSFLSGSWPTSNKYVDEIVKVYDATGDYEADYTPAADGFLIVFLKYGANVYASSAIVSTSQYIDFQTEIDNIDSRVGDVEDDIEDLDADVTELKLYASQDTVLSDKSDTYTVHLWAYMDTSAGKIYSQPESTGRQVVAYPVTAGHRYKVTASGLPITAIYGFIAFRAGTTPPAINDSVTILKSYDSANVSQDVPVTEDGYILLGFPSEQVFNRATGVFDWRLFLYSKMDSGTKLALPEKVYAVVGDTLQIFRRAVVEAVDPYAFDLSLKCEVGSTYPRYFQLNPASAGTKKLSAKLLNADGQILDEGEMDIIVKATPNSPGSMKRIAVFGDSLTQGGQWVTEVARRILSNDAESAGMPAGNNLSNIKFIGAMGSGDAKYYGVGGWGWNNYANEGSPAFRFQVTGVTSIVKGAVYSNNGHNYEVVENNTTEGTGNILCTTSDAGNTPSASGTLTKVSGSGDATITFASVDADQANPLWDADNEQISFSNYLANIGENTVDCVYFLIGWNIILTNNTFLDNQFNYAKDIIDALHTEYPSCTVRLMGLQLPSLNGGLGANYGASGGYSDLWNVIRAVRRYNARLKELAEDASYSSFVDYVDIASQFDSENNMPEALTMVNTRNTKTEYLGTNGVHPANPGYMQIADVAYRRVAYDLLT